MIDLKKVFDEAGTTTGVYHLSGGESGWTDARIVGDGTYLLKYEDSGWRCTYGNDGVRLEAGVITRRDGTKEDVPGGDHRNIVRFEPLDGAQACLRYPGIQFGFPP